MLSLQASAWLPENSALLPKWTTAGVIRLCSMGSKDLHHGQVTPPMQNLKADTHQSKDLQSNSKLVAVQLRYQTLI
jgi:hypothetical protein